MLNKKDRELIIKIARKQADQCREIKDIKQRLSDLFAEKMGKTDDGMNKIKVQFRDGRISTPQTDAVITKAMAEAITGLCQQLGIAGVDISYREAKKGRQT